MKVPVVKKLNPDGSPDYERHTQDATVDGVVVKKGDPVMRDETRDEILIRLRSKYELDAQGGDAYLAGIARENLDWLFLIDGGDKGNPDKVVTAFQHHKRKWQIVETLSGFVARDDNGGDTGPFATADEATAWVKAITE